MHAASSRSEAVPGLTKQKRLGSRAGEHGIGVPESYGAGMMFGRLGRWWLLVADAAANAAKTEKRHNCNRILTIIEVE